MKNNLGNTKMLKKRRFKRDLNDFDRLPKNLREWLIHAIYPWSIKSVKKIYYKALDDTGSAMLAIEELNKIQKNYLKKYKISLN